MKKVSKLIVLLLMTLLLDGCVIAFMAAYSSFSNPVEVSYFKHGFKGARFTNSSCFIADSCNISDKALKLDRMNGEIPTSFWIDLDTTFHQNNQVRIKVVKADGNVIRNLTCHLKPEHNSKIDYSDYEFIQTKKGNIQIKLNNKNYLFYQYPYDIIPHHFKIERPQNVPQHAIIQLTYQDGPWWSWNFYEGKIGELHKITSYDGNGKFFDECYFTFENEPETVPQNVNIITTSNYIEIGLEFFSNGQKQIIKTNEYPYGGYGKDIENKYIHHLLHSLEQNMYVKNFRKTICCKKPNSCIDWIRNQDVLKVVDNTVSSIGYSSFVSKDKFELKEYTITYNRISRWEKDYSLKNINDSLIIYYQDTNAPVYYKDFWKRRANENTDQILYKILRKIQNHYNTGDIETNDVFINDTLQQLLTFDLKMQVAEPHEEAKILLDYYNYLNHIGFKQSAYNLIFLCNATQSIPIDREKLYSQSVSDSNLIEIENKKFHVTSYKPNWIYSVHSRHPDYSTEIERCVLRLQNGF